MQKMQLTQAFVQGWRRPALLAPRGEAHTGAGARGGAIARHIIEPAQLQVFDSAGDRHPVENLRTAALQLVARQPLQEVRILVGECPQDAAVELLVDQKVAEPTEATTPTRALPGKLSTASRTT